MIFGKEGGRGGGDGRHSTCAELSKDLERVTSFP